MALPRPLTLVPFLLLTLPLGAAAQEAPGEGDLVITELVIAPASGSREWFELENVSGDDLELQGCVLAEGHYNDDKQWTGHDDTIDESLVIAAGERAVFMYGTSSDSDPLCAAYADEALTSCTVETAYRYRSLGFNNNDAELLTITCDKTVVDEVPFDWGEFSGDCPDDYDNNCSINLDPSQIDATANDEASNWGVPVEADQAWDHNGSPALGTPGAENMLFMPEPWCEAGDAIFTELMVDPPDGYDEWIEVHGTGDAPCNIGACELRYGLSDDATYEPTEEQDGWEWDVVEIEVPQDSLEVPAGGYVLLARTDEWVTGDGTGKADIPADFSYSGISLTNSEAKWLHLVCGDTVIDTAPVDWDVPTLAERCPEGNCSANLPEDLENSSDNDEVSNWCIPPLEPTYVNPSNEIIRATPGGAGACLELAWPAVGEVIFTEFMASPQGGAAEYIELLSLASSEVDLDFCSLKKHRLDEEDNIDESSIKTYVIGSDGSSLSVDAGATQLLSYGDCLFPSGDTGGVVDTGEGDLACSMGELVYSTIQMSGDEEEHLTLVCPDADGNDVEVDSTSFQLSVLGVRDGHSLMLDPDYATAEDNDFSSSWCMAAYSQKIEDLSDDVEDCNYGTPGVMDPCLVDTPEPLEPICRCSSRSAPGGWSALALLALAGVLFARREEDDEA